MARTEAALIYTVLADAASAREIAGILLEERLIACANILGEIESVFVWEGERSCARECAVLFKTSAEALEKAAARLSELHPYDTPAILASVCSHAHQDTLEWLASTLGPAA